VTVMKVLTVCLGNICRSPAAQGILQAKANIQGIDISLDSAGTAAYHVGNHPDPRSIAVLDNRGIDISIQRARQVIITDFEEFDWVLAMDKENVNNLKRICPSLLHYKIQLFGSINVNKNEKTTHLGEVVDPYYGNENDFSVMADHLDVLAEHFLYCVR